MRGQRRLPPTDFLVLFCFSESHPIYEYYCLLILVVLFASLRGCDRLKKTKIHNQVPCITHYVLGRI